MRLHFTVALVMMAGLAAAAPAELALVERSQPRARVLLGPGASADEREAARELVLHIQRATGVELPVAEAAGQGTVILVGPAACPRDVRDRIGRLQGEGFVIEASGRRLMLAGKPPHGTSFAVYTFLERYAGVRWLWPGESGTVVPKTASLRVPAISIEEQPAYLWRRLGPGGALWGPTDRWTKQRELGITTEHQAAQRLWEKRNRFGGQPIDSGHSFGKILPPAKYGPTNPEYYGLVDGKRDDWTRFDGKHRLQPCTTNADVIRLTVEYCRRYFQEHPDHAGVSIGLNDGRGFCECDRCTRLDTGAMQEERGDPDSGRSGPSRVLTDRIVTFGNHVAEELVKTHPDKKVLMLGYSQSRRAPTRVKAHPSLIVQYTFHAAEHWNTEVAARDYTEAEAWSRRATQLGIYEYLIQSRFPEMPRVIPELIAESVRRLHALGFRYYETQAGDGFALNGLNYYVLSKVLWNPSADAAAIERDYVEKGFGAAKPAMARYFRRMADRWKEAKAGDEANMLKATLAQYRIVTGLYPPEFVAACRRDLEEARALARGEEKVRVEFVAAGFRYLEMTMDAIGKTIPLLAGGWGLSSRKVIAPPSRDMDTFKRALAAWQTRESYIRSVKNDFVADHVWIRYNDLVNGFNPLERMRAFRAAAEGSVVRY